MKIDFDLYWLEIGKGDVHALEKIYRSCFGSLVFYASEITGQKEVAEEVVQDVFLKIWQTRSDIKIQGSFKAYLFKCVHNYALNALRKMNSRKESANLLAPERTWQFISDNYRIDDNLIEHIFSDETETIIWQAIGKLPDQCHKVFMMSRFESIKNEDIAARLGLSVNTVRTHIFKALQKITDALDHNK